MHVQHRHLVWFAVASLLLAASCQTAFAQLTDEQARKSIKQGVDYLKGQQKANGSWPEMSMYPGGITSLCTLALLNCGEDPKSPTIQQALAYLRSLGEPAMVYSTSLQTMVFCAAEPNKDRGLILQNVQWLEKTQLKEGMRKGAWNYAPGKGNGDNSNAQFALLALHEAERIGVTVNPETWKLALEYWVRTQRDDGSWAYTESDHSTGSMTCAGIASVIICLGQLGFGDASVKDGRVECCGEQTDHKAVESGLRWLGDKFSPARNPSTINLGRTYWYYYLYGVERVGRMSGRRFLGNHDWFREGAELLVSQQDDLRGLWQGEGHGEREPLVATPLALLFLSKGRRPVLMSKVKHAAADWDLHRNAVQNLTSRVERRWRRDLTWQTVDIQYATVEDLLESPVLFLSGRSGLPLSFEEEKKLKEYVSRGGFIFAEACCEGDRFDQEFRGLVSRLFPDSGLRLLPPDHAIWFAEQKVDPDFVKPLYGVEACCRTSVVYSPQDLSCYWELSRGSRETSYPDPVKREVEAALRIGANVLTYATNRELRNKLDKPMVRSATASANPLERETLVMPKLEHSGGSDDAPNALPNLMEFFRAQGQLRLSVENRLISASDRQLFEYPLVFMHGRRSFRFSPEERTALKQYIDRGGVVFADAICANPQFTESFRREMESIVAGQPWQRIPPDHPLFTRAYRGFDLTQVTLRDPQIRTGDDPLRANLTQISPVLEGLTVDDRLVVIFSPFDISCALESGVSLECKGYVKEDAARLAVNVILFVLQQ